MMIGVFSFNEKNLQGIKKCASIIIVNGASGSKLAGEREVKSPHPEDSKRRLYEY